jgi:hypothetical protein
MSRSSESSTAHPNLIQGLVKSLWRVAGRAESKRPASVSYPKLSPIARKLSGLDNLRERRDSVFVVLNLLIQMPLHYPRLKLAYVGYARERSELRLKAKSCSNDSFTYHDSRARIPFAAGQCWAVTYSLFRFHEANLTRPADNPKISCVPA